MARQKKSKRGNSRRPQERLPPEERRAEVLTVAWMLTLVATVGAQLVAFGSWMVLRRAAEPEQVPPPLAMLPPLLWLVAVVTGLICLVLTPLVYRFRRTPPPPAISVFALVAGGLPLLVTLVMWVAVAW